jgi:hypothetical protein
MMVVVGEWWWYIVVLFFGNSGVRWFVADDGSGIIAYKKQLIPLMIVVVRAIAANA